MNDSTMISTIFAPTPLLELHNKYTWNDYITYVKKGAIPLSCCFLYALNQNNILSDIAQSPCAVSIFIYLMIHYNIQRMLYNQQNQLHQEIIETMQHIFHLLIIGHGIYNKINAPDYLTNKTSITIDAYQTTTLQLFLHKAYSAWCILFSYYEEHYKSTPLYAYKINQIDLFEVLQASTHEPDILPLITHFYNKNNTIHNYESILDCLEIKLKLINHKMISIVPNQ